jgi:hypothetical protein
MKLVEMNWNPNNRQLRQFGLVALVALPLLGWLWSGSPTAIWITAAVGAALAAAGLLYPRVVKPVFLGLTLVAVPIGMVISEVALAVVFYGLFVPLGLIFRLIGRDVLQLKLERQTITYWQRKKRPSDASSYLRQS